MLLIIWAVTLVFAFTLIHWAIGSQINSGGTTGGFLTDLYYSGTTFSTLGLGDLTPITSAARVITVLEASMGLGLLALVIGYFPVLYQAFSRRSEEHTSELQSLRHLVCRLLLEKKNITLTVSPSQLSHLPPTPTPASHPLSLHDALPIFITAGQHFPRSDLATSRPSPQPQE